MLDPTPILPSGSTNGRPIKITTTSTPGTLIHTATSASDELDEVWVWAVNTDTTARLTTIQMGGTTAPDDNVVDNLSAQSGLSLMVAGQRVNGGVAVRAFAAAANVVNIVANVNRIKIIP